jgi:quinolinate synthase
VRDKLAQQRSAGGPEISAEIVFPVAAEAVAATADRELPIVPGVLQGEGCSTVGGCASCPFMKMNSLDALLDLLQRIDGDPAELARYAPKQYQERIDGRSITELAGRTIVRMREFQRTGRLSDELVAALGRGD